MATDYNSIEAAKRSEALQLAVRLEQEQELGSSDEAIVARAGVFYEFLNGGDKQAAPEEPGDDDQKCEDPLCPIHNGLLDTLLAAAAAGGQVRARR